MATVFTHDPSSTAAFAALGQTPPVAAPGEHLRAVVIGGGTGAPVSIRTLLSMQVETAAVVAMADDGGSTGILREEADVTPPGDVRKCIAAMAADPTDPLTRAFKYRFPFARNHTLGNLMLSALEDAAGSFPEAIAICERLLDAQGRVYPSTLDRVTLVARTRDGREIEGQAVACHSRTALERVGLRAAHPIRAYEPALEAIRAADLIVLGPGSLFTSIIPNLLVPGVVDAIRASRGCTLFVCSLADMQGETWGLTVREHVEALMDHGMRGLVDYVLVHAPAPLRPDGPATGAFDAVGGSGLRSAELGEVDEARWGGSIRPVAVTYRDVQAIQAQGPVVIARDLVDTASPTWHDPAALRNAFSGVLKLCRSRQR
ncbi:gluconeogenesis factor YvcK family protein [Gordonibacter sp.]|uniref:gluconeogenesis factor YvcK family protein n=1 Tax=Gordonibacter sp. TaxID=1968902 RepID=UPI002FC60B50